jgi:hypothetical protein
VGYLQDEIHVVEGVLLGPLISGPNSESQFDEVLVAHLVVGQIDDRHIPEALEPGVPPAQARACEDDNTHAGEAAHVYPS